MEEANSTNKITGYVGTKDVPLMNQILSRKKVIDWIEQTYGNIDILDRIDNTDPYGKSPDFWPEEIKQARETYLNAKTPLIS